MKNIMMILCDFLSQERIPGLFADTKKIDYLFYLYEHVHLQSLLYQTCQDFYYVMNVNDQFLPRVKELHAKYHFNPVDHIFYMCDKSMMRILMTFVEEIKNDFDHLAFFRFDGDDGLPATWIENIFNYVKKNEQMSEMFYLYPEVFHLVDLTFGKFQMNLKNEGRGYGNVQVYPRKLIPYFMVHHKILKEKNVIKMPEENCAIYYMIQNLNQSNCLLFHIYNQKANFQIIIDLKDIQCFPEARLKFDKVFFDSKRILDERYRNPLDLKCLPILEELFKGTIEETFQYGADDITRFKENTFTIDVKEDKDSDEIKKITRPVRHKVPLPKKDQIEVKKEPRPIRHKVPLPKKDLK